LYATLKTSNVLTSIAAKGWYHTGQFAVRKIQTLNLLQVLKSCGDGSNEIHV